MKHTLYSGYAGLYLHFKIQKLNIELWKIKWRILLSLIRSRGRFVRGNGIARFVVRLSRHDGHQSGEDEDLHVLAAVGAEDSTGNALPASSAPYIRKIPADSTYFYFPTCEKKLGEQEKILRWNGLRERTPPTGRAGAHSHGPAGHRCSPSSPPSSCWPLTASVRYQEDERERPWIGGLIWSKATGAESESRLARLVIKFFFFF